MSHWQWIDYSTARQCQHYNILLTMAPGGTCYIRQLFHRIIELSACSQANPHSQKPRFCLLTIFMRLFLAKIANINPKPLLMSAGISFKLS